MLHIIGSSPVPLAQVVVDEYIPLKFRAYESVLPGCYLWQTGNLRTSLLEMRIDWSTKAIYGVTLTLYRGKVENVSPFACDDCQTIAALPVVDLTEFTGDYAREVNDFRLARTRNSVFVMLKPQFVPERCFRAGRIGFFEAEEHLCAIGFFDLTDTEIETAGRTLGGEKGGKKEKE